MPELPDVTLYVEHLRRRIVGATLVRVRVVSPNLLRTVEPPLESLEGLAVTGVERMGKRIVMALEGDRFLVLHLMIAGRLHWKDAAPAELPLAPEAPARTAASRRRTVIADDAPPALAGLRAGLGRNGLAAFTFSTGTLTLTEASKKQRAGLHVIEGREALDYLDPHGLEPLTATLEEFRDALLHGNHTLKRALTDPRAFSGIGNAYSDEILHRARLSPLRLTRQLTDDELERLWHATRETLVDWTERLRAFYGDRFPEKVTAFREGMAVHGRHRQPCPDCGAPVQRIVYAENECNYCARCQTQGRLLADRSLSRLLKSDWPRTLEEWEGLRASRRREP
jgi:formamidopyrimidine-DNA glycosylase